MANVEQQSPLLLKYLRVFEQNPESRVFAPLAETYRKMGMLDDALSVLKDGVKKHPDYITGYVCLAACYFDQGRYELTYATLKPLISRNLDNILLQKTFAKACEKLGHLEEALETYKYLLFLNPRDKNFIVKVRELAESEAVFVRNEKIESPTVFHTDKLHQNMQSKSTPDVDDWVTVDFSHDETDMTGFHSDSDSDSDSDSEPESNWEVDAESPFEESLAQESAESPQSEGFSGFDPVITHTLVDLYEGQGLYEKACEILEKMCELNPQEHRTLHRLKELRLKTGNAVSEAGDEGHERLMQFYDSRLGESKQQNGLLLQKFQRFLSLIHQESALRQA